MFTNRDTQKALDVRDIFREIGGELAGAKGSACLTASGAIQNALHSLGLVMNPDEAEEVDHGTDPSGNPSKTY